MTTIPIPVLPSTVYLMVMVLGAGLSAFSFALAIAYYLPVKAVEIEKAPPAEAHGILLPSQPLAADVVEAQRTAEVLYHALIYCEGRCSVRPLYTAIADKWNAQIEGKPELDQWVIGYKSVANTLKGLDYDTTGRVVQLDGHGVLPGHYVVLNMGRNVGRRLVSVEEMVKKFRGEIEPEDVDELEAAAVSPDGGGVADMPNGVV